MKSRNCSRLELKLVAATFLVGIACALTAANVAAQPAPIAVSINAGETYSIDHIKTGTHPTIRVLQNPNAMLSRVDGPNRLVLIGAESGRWAIGVTEDSGRTATYNVRVLAYARPEAPGGSSVAPPAMSDSLAPRINSGGGIASSDAAPPPLTDMNLGPRVGAGTGAAGIGRAGFGPPAAGSSMAPPASTDMNLRPRIGEGIATPGLYSAPADVVRIPGPANAPRGASEPATDIVRIGGGDGSARGAATEAPAEDASWGLAAVTGHAVIPAISTQATGKLETRSGQYRTDPPIVGPDSDYTTEAISGGRHYLPDDAVSLMSGGSSIIDFKRRLTRISIADSKIADVQVINPFQINLIAHLPGFTTIAVWDSTGNYEERQVRVDPSGRQQVMLNTLVAELDRTEIENQGVNVSVAFLNSGISFVSLPGLVATPFSGTSSSPGSITSLPPAGSIIPMLLSQNLTYGLATQGSGVATQTFFQFLEEHNLGRILAEPHLLANSGEKAKFLSGGEIPIVIAQALNSTIVFKQFGTSVEFIPTVVGRNEIELLVKPEVSQPDYAHGVQLFGFTVPAFVTRRVEILVRLKDRQTLIIAGLILHEKLSTVAKVPYLGDIPLLGAAFRNTYWENKESDLVMSVTPEIVRPLPAPSDVFLPGARGPMTHSEVETHRIDPPDPSRPRF